MRSDVLYDNLLETLNEKFQQKSKLTNALTDILFIEKEAVYRRLRKEVPFTFHEVATIAQHWDLSLDNIIGLTPAKSRPFQLKLAEHVNPTESDYMMMQHYIDLLNNFSNDPSTEIMHASNVLSKSLYLPFDNLTRYHMFKWMYQYSDRCDITPYKDIAISDRLRKFQINHSTLIKDVPKMTYIWDYQIFEYIVNDIKYFNGINLISDDEAEEIKKDLLKFLGYTESIAIMGGNEGHSGKVNMYISHLNFDTSYCYISSGNFKLSIIKAFIMNSAISFDDKAFEKMKRWVQSLKRTSTLISESGERERIEFFAKQRKVIDSI